MRGTRLSTNNNHGKFLDFYKDSCFMSIVLWLNSIIKFSYLENLGLNPTLLTYDLKTMLCSFGNDQYSILKILLEKQGGGDPIYFFSTSLMKIKKKIKSQNHTLKV